MTTHELVGADPAPPRERRRRRWWQGGSSVRRWDAQVLGWGIIGLGAALIGGMTASRFLGPTAGSMTLWVALAVPVVLAFRRSIPRGLLSVRAVDLLYAIVIGLALRVLQGVLASTLTGDAAFPSYPTLDGALPSGWWIDGLLFGGLVAPVVEEFFFRGLLLVALFTVVRRALRRSGAAQGEAGLWVAGVVAILATTVLFVLVHQLVSPLRIDAALSLAALSVATGLLVILTGRLWPAVFVHVVFNVSGVALTVIGTVLG